MKNNKISNFCNEFKSKQFKKKTYTMFAYGKVIYHIYLWIQLPDLLAKYHCHQTNLQDLIMKTDEIFIHKLLFFWASALMSIDVW